jgi:hypothetical protein
VEGKARIQERLRAIGRYGTSKPWHWIAAAIVAALAILALTDATEIRQTSGKPVNAPSASAGPPVAVPSIAGATLQRTEGAKSGPSEAVQFKAGETAKIEIGGSGRPVTGRFKVNNPHAPIDWQKVEGWVTAVRHQHKAIDQFKASPNIPETLGNSRQNKGNLEGFRSNRDKMAELLDKEIDIHVDHMPLEQVVFKLGQEEGITFMADQSLPAFKEKLSINAKGVPLSELLDYFSRNTGLQFQVGSDLIWITEADVPPASVKTPEPQRAGQPQPGIQRASDSVRIYPVQIAEDGSFRIEEMVPGKYLLRVRIPDPRDPDAVASARYLADDRKLFEVPPPADSNSRKPLDVGVFELKLKPRTE